MAGEPLARFIGGTRAEIATGISLGIQSSPAALIDKARAALEAGYRKVKIKIEPGRDVEWIGAVRAALGPDAHLMADANNAYTLDDIERLVALDGFGLMMIEQPLACDDIVRHAELQRRLRTPICLDESITGLDRAQDMVTLDSGRIVNIKSGRVGGFTSVDRHPRFLPGARRARLVRRHARERRGPGVQRGARVAPEFHPPRRREPERALLGARHRLPGVDDGPRNGARTARPAGNRRRRGRRTHRRAHRALGTAQAVSGDPGFTAADRRLLTELRRDLHRHPELSWHETRTQETLERALLDAGVTDVRRIARTGLVARVRGRVAGTPVVALRGDIDALPITEATGLDFASVNDGVMHACGHDVHAAWAVGAALLLARAPSAGDVLVVLQPAEEVGEGAREVLASGALDGVSAIFGAHVDRRFALGQAVAQAGPLAASTDTFRIVLRGEGAHGARPQEARDPIVGAAELIGALQTIVSRRLDPALPGVVTVGAVHAGRAANVIPETAELTGTIRATTAMSRTLLVGELDRMARTVAETHRLAADVQITQGTPPVVNSPEGAAWAAQAVREVLGEQSLVPLGTANMGGEDFAFYLEKMPGCFLRIGAREPGGERLAAHTPRFYPAEDSLFIGAAVLAQCARAAGSPSNG